MYLADYHTHSSVSPDGSVTVSELAGAAIDHGLNEICVTDHVDTVLWGSHLPRTSFDWAAVARQVAEARQRCGDRLTIRMGIRQKSPGARAAAGRCAGAGLRHRVGTHGRRKISPF